MTTKKDDAKTLMTEVLPSPTETPESGPRARVHGKMKALLKKGVLLGGAVAACVSCVACDPLPPPPSDAGTDAGPPDAGNTDGGTSDGGTDGG